LRPGRKLEELGLAMGSDGPFLWNEKGQAIAERAGVTSTAALVRAVECMNIEIMGELEERWLRNASN
jgi:hypothetical protein